MAKLPATAFARNWQARELPVVDERLCTGCGRCVLVCPADCLAMDRGLPWLPRPADCISCGACVYLCPPLALALVSPAATA